MLNKLLKIILALDLIVVNGVAGYLMWKNITPELRSSPLNLRGDTRGDMVTKTEYVDQCGEECKKYIDSKTIVSVEVTPKPTVKPVVTKKTRKEEILTIPGSGSTSNIEWTNLSGTEFYFDTRDYPGLVEVYFEASMKLVNGGGSALVRLYDVTNNISPVGGQNDTQSQVDVWTKSQKVYFWAGKNLIRIQAKSQLPDVVMYNGGRLRIVVES